MHRTTYDGVAHVYDILSWLYSAGGIARAKQEPLAYLKSGEKVLYAGAGSGEECVAAAAKGVSVTAMDCSSVMLGKLRRRLDRAALSGRLLCSDVRLHEERYQAVVAPFFLNVFARNEVGPVWQKLGELVSPGGYLISVDFRGPSQSIIFRLLQRAYYLAPLLLFRWAVGNPWHELYDYRQIAKESGSSFKLVAAIPTRVFGFTLLETLVWKAS